MNASKDRAEYAEKDKFTPIFENRRQLQMRKEYFRAFHKVKKDDDMWRHNVSSHYDYAVLKIQKWWRKRNFDIAVEYTVIRAATQKTGALGGLPDASFGGMPSIEQKSRVLECAANIKRVDVINQELEMMAHRKDWDFIRTI
jgi:hypothetical protein